MPRPALLFICVENANRSQMAEAFAKALGGDRILAASAGSRPSGRLNPRAVRFMAELGIDLSAQMSKGLDDLPRDVTWDAVVTMGCGDTCPFVPARERLDWDLPDPKDQDDAGFREVRDRIRELVHGLLERVAPAEP